MLDRGFLVDLPAGAQHELAAKQEPKYGSLHLRDLNSWLWSSIDNDDSRDLDQVEYAQQEAGGIRIYVAIADVDWFVNSGSSLDNAAGHNTTSVYTGVQTFPMLPERLSTDLSSLNQDETRVAMVSEMLIDDEGRITDSSVYPATVRNRAKLAYNSVAAWLEEDPEAKAPEIILSNPELQAQLRLQDEAARLLRDRRHEAGALSFRTLELQPIVSSEGIVVDLQSKQHNRATLLIEDFMIAANQTTAGFLQNRGLPSIRRVVRDPERWDRIRALASSLGGSLSPEPDARSLEAFLQQQQRANPTGFPDLSLSIIKLLGRGEYIVKAPGAEAPGHFGLAVENYSHSTAPNRRYADLITQRLLKAALKRSPLQYSSAQLEAIATRCTAKEDDANKVERLVKKCAAAAMLQSRVGQAFDAIVSGVNYKGAWVRLLHPPVEGKLLGAQKHLDVGNRLRVRLESVDPERGFIDFEIVN